MGTQGMGKGAHASGMGMWVSPNRARRRAMARKRQEKSWAAKASKVTVTKLCEVEDCDGSCDDWHRL